MSDATDPHDITQDMQAGSTPANGASRSDHPQRIGRYRIEKVLGKGGFGLVYLAHDEQLDRRVAVKVPHARLINRPEDAEPYLTEARTVAGLDHPHIVPVYDVGSSAEFPCYIVSKFIEGMDLATRIKQSRPDFASVAELVATVAEALHYAHKQGLVDRDVKPGNILLDQDNRPYVVDFGLALREADVGKGPRYAGTPAYMSPEQVRGEGHRVDGRSDIYSLGAVLYELLTGRRTVSADTQQELLEQITSQEVKPPRQIDDRIPKELERICLKALAKRASDRYTTALDMAEDLRHCLATQPRSLSETSAASVGSTGQSDSTRVAGDSGTTRGDSATDSDSQLIKIVPKGLRSFDAHDADFFLELLPGPRDREGLPDSIRFWKTRFEETDADNTFSVGLIYGPSGCGKSSLVKAGLLPRLSEGVIPVYVEATPEETETRLLHGLRKRCPALEHNLSLKETLAALRRGQGIPVGKKVLIVLDQFEQWLHVNKEVENTDLVQALRQCDGNRVQCIVMVRDDFWLAVSRFGVELEVDFVPGNNMALTDLFDVDHARKVLAAFGRAFGRLPDQISETTKEQREFLKQAVAGLAEEGKVICVRLALFFEMMKGKEWTPTRLNEVGGTKGVGVTFLEETFSAQTAVPRHRLHQKAARAVLNALLPDSGTDIKGHMRSRAELLEASGYANRLKDFDDLIRILDSEIRLITPTDPEGKEADEDSVTTPTTAGEKYYQLTHDYLVPSLRDWLTRKQKETRQGRAELTLADRAAVWQARPENRQLPSLLQWLQIRRYTRSRSWSEPQRKMMNKAARVHGLRSALTIASLMVVGLLSFAAYSWLQGRAAVETLLAADPQSVLAAADNATTYRFWTADELQNVAASDAETRDERRRQRHARLALLPFDSTQGDPLLDDALTTGDTAYVGVIRKALLEADAAIEDDCWSRFRNSEQPAERFRAGVMLAGLAPNSDQWTEMDVQLLVDELAALNSVYQPQFWPLLQDVGDRMLPPLEALFNNRERPENEQLAAANAIAFFAEQDAERLARLLLIASGPQYNILYEKYREVADEPTSEVFATSVQQQPTDDLDAEERTALGQERATSAITLLRQGERESILDALRYQDDPETLTQFVHRCRARSVTPAELIELLELVDQRRGPLDGERQKHDDSVMYALLLALGDFAWDDLPPTRQTLVERLALIYEQDPSSGVHSACGWLLRQWGQGEAVDRIDQTPLPYDPTGHREWFVREIEYEGIGGSFAERNNLYLTFIVFQPREFTMGSPEEEQNHLSDEAQHQVTLTRPIAVCDRELTWSQWMAREGTGRRDAYARQFSKTLGANDPVFGVSWFDSVAYCRWLSEQAGLSEEEQCYKDPSLLPKDGEGNPTNWPLRLEGAGFRLPTEAEWEFICRSGTGTAYSFGHDEQLLDRYAWYLKNSGDWSHATGELRPNPRGLFDIHGNVTEWCHDWYNEGDLSGASDPLGAETGSSRVRRGGCLSSTAGNCRSSSRGWVDPTYGFNALGFRLAAVPSSQLPEAREPGSGADSAGR